MSGSHSRKINGTPKKGFTLVELIVGVAILGLLVMLAIPSMSQFIVRMRVDNEVSEIQRLMLTARNTAINTGINTSVCPLSGNACSGSNDWTGEIGVVNSDGIVKVKTAIKSGDKLTFNKSAITYTASGRLTTINDTGVFSYCPSGHDEFSRGVEVSASGRAYSSTDTDNDGKDETRSNVEIACS